MPISDPITKCKSYLGCESQCSTLCVSQALLRINRSGTNLQQNFVLPDFFFTIVYDIILYFHSCKPRFFRFNVPPSRRGTRSASQTTLGHGTEYESTDYSRQRGFQCWTSVVISDTGGAWAWKYSFCYIAVVNMSSEDVNMLIEMGFPRNKAYVYSLTI